MDFKKLVITFGNKLETEDMGTDPLSAIEDEGSVPMSFHIVIARKYLEKEPKNLDFLEKKGYNNKA